MILVMIVNQFLRAIQDSPYHMCKSCRHLMLENEIDNYKPGMGAAMGLHAKLVHCPLCHSPLIGTTGIGGHK